MLSWPVACASANAELKMGAIESAEVALGEAPAEQQRVQRNPARTPSEEDEHEGQPLDVIRPCHGVNEYLDDRRTLKSELRGTPASL